MRDGGEGEPWHALAGDACLAALAASVDGLSEAEAKRRLGLHGANVLPPSKRPSPLRRIAAQFHNVLIYLLLAAAAITALLGHGIDAGVILAVVLLNTVIGALQEGRAERSLDAIRRVLSTQALVVRSGERVLVPAAELVSGDIVVIQSGDKVPADLRLLRVHELRIDESALTGESLSVEKSADPVAEAATVGDRRGMAFTGTLVTYGQALGLVVGTGTATELGRINRLLGSVVPLVTPLLRQVATFGRWLSIAIVAVSLLAFAVAVGVWERPLAEVFLATVSLAVAAIPEGLPAMLTVTLAVGVQRMAARHAIVRRLAAIDTIGSVGVICTDKTGTLTRNEMTVRSVVTPAGEYAVTGGGYAPVGGFHSAGREVLLEERPDLVELMRAGLLCNDARLVHQSGRWEVVGDPTEGALVTAAVKGGLVAEVEAAQQPRTDSIPFESEHRFMATLHHDHTGAGTIYVKGAPERVIAMCTSTSDTRESLEADRWHACAEALAARGERVLALAKRPAARDHIELRHDDVRTGLRLLGLVGMLDPPREEAVAAVADCVAAGIRVKMITGDHAATARAIGAVMGIGDGTTSLTGQQIDALDEAALRRAVGEVAVFARVSPEHKLRLVEAISAVDGSVVAMTGDGVNDAPALKRADIGIAMGRGGTEVAKEASDIVLTDDDFASIRHAVEIGRSVYDNLRKTILFTMPTNGGEALTVLLALLTGAAMPITPVQILWVNMVTSVLLSFGLAFEPPEPDVMRRPPRRPDASLLPRLFVWRVVLVSLLMCGGTYGLYLHLEGAGHGVDQARTAAVNALVLYEAVYLVSTRSVLRSAVASARVANPLIWAGIAFVVVMQALYTYLPLSHRLFATAGIGFHAWLLIAGSAAMLFAIIEAEKALMRRWHTRRRCVRTDRYRLALSLL